MNNIKTFVIDIDGTVCTNTDGEYEKAEPYLNRIKKINSLYDLGHKIVMLTARGSTTNIDWTEITRKQLKEWGLNYHELKLGKPYGDYYVDDKAVTEVDFFAESDIKNPVIVSNINNFQSTLKTFYSDYQTLEKLEYISNIIFDCFSRGGKLILCGNGGSMSDSLHISAEFTGRFKLERDPYPSIVLGANQSSLSAIANDYGYSDVFKRELEALGNENDVLLTLTTSGKSENVLNCLACAKEKNIKTICFTSLKSNDQSFISDVLIKVKSHDTALIQQMHMFFGHIICDMIDNYKKK